jgi:hypothetical protein
LLGSSHSPQKKSVKNQLSQKPKKEGDKCRLRPIRAL